MRRKHLLVLGVLGALLAGCGVAPRAVMVDRNPAADGSRRAVHSAQPGRVITVQRGDTLYGLAFRHGLDYRQVASWNGIAAPYTIYPGQQIRLSPRQQAGARPAPVVATAPRTTAPARPMPSSTAPTGSTRPRSPPPVAAPSRPMTPPVTATPAPPVTSPTPTSAAAPRWQWPTSGQVVGRFVPGDPTRQGISIVGSAGQPVNSASDGVVVYSGSGLIGYGELVIVKHNDEFLSAYGHNRKRLVAEGEQVRAGQQIAEMGRSGAARDMLHFEIRLNGKPVDPAAHLPPR
jgi:lipoprotein NlpD